MWEKIKALFQSNQQGPPAVIEPIKYEDGLFWFRSQTELKLSRYQVAAPSKMGYFGVDVDVLSYDENSKMYRAKIIENETFALDAMKIERRKEFRLEAPIAVTSEELSGKKGQTEDLSLNGARLLIGGPLKPGEHIGIKILFNDAVVENLSLRCEVSWCSPTRKGKYHCGVRFFTIDKADRAKIKRYIENRVVMGGKK